MITQNLRRGFHAVKAGQADIHQHQVRARLLYELHGIGAVLGFTHDAKFLPSAQDGPDTVPHDLVIIHQKDVEGHE